MVHVLKQTSKRTSRCPGSRIIPPDDNHGDNRRNTNSGDMIRRCRGLACSPNQTHFSLFPGSGGDPGRWPQRSAGAAEVRWAHRATGLKGLDSRGVDRAGHSPCIANERISRRALDGVSSFALQTPADPCHRSECHAPGNEESLERNVSPPKALAGCYGFCSFPRK